jgi:hypothetical protein
VIGSALAKSATAFTFLPSACQKRVPIRNAATPEVALKPEEIRKLDAYFKRTFKNPSLQVKARPRKEDSCELYLGDEFLGIIFKDEDDGELSYNFSMAILDVDLD